MTKAKKTKNKKVATKKAAAAKKTTTRDKVNKKKVAGDDEAMGTPIFSPATEAQLLSAIGGIEKNIRAIDLKHADYNPRKISEKEMAELKHSIRSGGFTQRVIVNSYPGRENVIVGGHQRVKALMEMGIESIPCIVVSYDLTTEKEMNIRYNKNIGNWDFDLLELNFQVKDLGNWGFEDFELNGFDTGIKDDGIDKFFKEDSEMDVAGDSEKKEELGEEEEKQITCPSCGEIFKP